MEVCDGPGQNIDKQKGEKKERTDTDRPTDCAVLLTRKIELVELPFRSLGGAVTTHYCAARALPLSLQLRQRK